MTLPAILTIVSTIVFLLLERATPGRQLPQARGWYARALAITAAQVGITLLTYRIWPRVFGESSLFALHRLHAPLAEGFIAWFVGTFIFYWWHRVRHLDGFWHVFHQVHHSPSRIETITAFYKHPIEIAADAILSATVIYGLLGCSVEGAFWYNFFAATGEYFYHVNLSTPAWLRYVIQTPELHSIHHEYDSHAYNYGDITLWDRLFGTYRDTCEFVPRCGFPEGAESRLAEMLIFRDVYESADERAAR
jgi:sterol desaturase/sphingolipid hydroxylase (fatty acid hydroxylase superfamily)